MRGFGKMPAMKAARNFHSLFAVFAFAAFAGCCGSCDPFADDSWAKRRAEALARPRTFVYNTDGNDAHNWPSNLPVTVENFTGRRLAHALGTHVTTISYCPLSSGFGRLTCRKAGEAYCVRSHRGLKHVSADLFAMGTDPLELASVSSDGKPCIMATKWKVGAED